MRDSAATLRRWVTGRLLGMVILGGVTALGLWVLGVPLPLALGVLTGILCLIPNFGPLLSLVPPVVLAIGGDADNAGWSLALQVVLLFLAIQTLESYVLTPLIEKKAVELPPAALIVAQIFGGALVGLLGVLLAAPVLAVVLRLRRGEV